MSRVTDTRIRTREAASRLVSAGRRPHELTVDLIYAEIRQGSRTTINDELKLWKDEQARVDALSAALPPAVANAMMSIWALAVEHGEGVFGQRRDEVESDLAKALQHSGALEAALAKQQDEGQTLRSGLEAAEQTIAMLRSEAEAAHAQAEAAQARGQALTEQLEASRAEAEHRLEAAKAEHQQREAELQAALAASELTFRAEIDKTTERLEGVQKHVMVQVADARESAKRAEALLAKASQRNETLSAEIQKLRAQLQALGDDRERAQRELEKLCGEAEQLRTERDSLRQQLAALGGKLDAQTAQIESLERRAVGAELRLDTTLKRKMATEKSVTRRNKPDPTSVGDPA